MGPHVPRIRQPADRTESGGPGRLFRIEFAHELAEQVTRIARAFEEALAGQRAGRELTQTLQRIAPQRVTEGGLYVPESSLLNVLLDSRPRDEYPTPAIRLKKRIGRI